MSARIAQLSDLHLTVAFHDWWSRVAFPAFEKNWTVLWERDTEAAR